MDLEEVDEEWCLEALSDVQPEVVRHCVRAYGKGQQGEGRFALDIGKIARFKADQIFRDGLGRPQGDVWAKDAFYLEWEASLPSTCRLDPHLLKGIAIAEDIGAEACLRYLPETTLPLDPAVRLKRLFDFRKRWALVDLEPYLR